MSDKIIDLNPEVRVSREALKCVQEMVSSFTIDEIDSILTVYVKKDGTANFSAYGISWTMLGLAQGYLEELRSEMLEESEIEDLSPMA